MFKRDEPNPCKSSRRWEEWAALGGADGVGGEWTALGAAVDPPASGVLMGHNSAGNVVNTLTITLIPVRPLSLCVHVCDC